VGSRSKIKLAYIAGFLDGDGSLMLQLKKRKDGNMKFRFMVTICLYQDVRHADTLYWIKDFFGIGYLSNRNDGITEYRINGYKTSREILKSLEPFIRFKKIQVQALLEACDILCSKKYSMLTEKELRRLVDLILVIQNENYVSRNKKSKNDLLKILDLTP